MINIKSLIESRKSPEQVLSSITEADSIMVVYKQHNKGEGNNKKWSEKFTRKEISEFVDDFDMYTQADNLPKWMIVAHAQAFNFRSFRGSAKLVKSFMEEALTKKMVVEVEKIEDRRGFSGSYIYKMKINGKDVNPNSLK